MVFDIELFGLPKKEIGQVFLITLVALLVALFVFSILIGSFSDVTLGNLNTIAEHPNMTSEGQDLIDNSFTMYALLPFVLTIAIIVGIFLLIVTFKD